MKSRRAGAPDVTAPAASTVHHGSAKTRLDQPVREPATEAGQAASETPRSEASQSELPPPELFPPELPPPELEENERPEMPLPHDPKSIFLGGLFFLALLTAFHVASEIVLPILLAIVLKLLLQPALRPLERLHINRTIGALITVLVLAAGIVGFGALVAGPAEAWMQKIPESLPRIEQHVRDIMEPFLKVEGLLKQAERVTEGPADGTPAVTVKGKGLADTVLIGTATIITGILTTILLLFFLLAAGDTFLRRVVEVLPRFKDKRQAVDIVQHIEHDVSVYLLTISAINLAVGVATGIAMHFCGVGDALLWGAAAFLLNYVPILGPLVGVGMFGLVGLASFDTLGGALLPAGLYLLIHVAEGEIITPLLLARRLTLNPVLIILSLIFWYWMWGVPGAILAVPLLAIIKITCDRIRPLAAFGHFLEGKNQA